MKKNVQRSLSKRKIEAVLPLLSPIPEKKIEEGIPLNAVRRRVLHLH
jgi:hypothetical protein